MCLLWEQACCPVRLRALLRSKAVPHAPWLPSSKQGVAGLHAAMRARALGSCGRVFERERAAVVCLREEEQTREGQAAVVCVRASGRHSPPLRGTSPAIMRGVVLLLLALSLLLLAAPALGNRPAKAIFITCPGCVWGLHAGPRLTCAIHMTIDKATCHTASSCEATCCRQRLYGCKRCPRSACSCAHS